MRYFGVVFFIGTLCLLWANDIAFVGLTDEGWQLFVSSEEGKGTRQLTHIAGDAREPSWFSDGKRIAFTNTAGHVYIIHAPRGALADSIVSDEYYFWQAVPNRDGTKLYLVAGRPKEIDKTFIAVADLKTKNKLREVLRLATPVYHIDVSPVNDDIVFANTLCGSVCGKIIQEIWLKRGDSKRSRQLHLLDAMSRYPKWMPDGKSIIFDSEQNSSFTLWTQSIGSRQPKPLFADSPLGDMTQPAVSPDGKRILFIKEGRLYRASLTSPGQAQPIYPVASKPKMRIKDPAW